MYTEQVLIKELQWEYNLSFEKAKSIVETYKNTHRYKELCQAIEHRNSIPIRRLKNVQ